MMGRISSADGTCKVTTPTGISITIDLANVNHLTADSSILSAGNNAESSNKTEVFPPTAVLFGWVGASVKQLRKYGALFRAMKYHVVYVVAPVWVVFALLPSTIRKFTLSILRVVATEANGQLMDGGVVWQFFSNGGAYCAEHMGRLFQQIDEKREKERISNTKNRLHNNEVSGGEIRKNKESGDGDEDIVRRARDTACAFIFDSAPCYPHASSAGNALVHALDVQRGSYRECCVLGANGLLEATRRVVVGDRASAFWNSMLHADFHCPELYIYSDSDRLVDVGKLDELVVTRRKQRRSIYTMRLQDSSHVSILRTHPIQYTDAIRGVNSWVNQWRTRQNISDWIIGDIGPRAERMAKL